MTRIHYADDQITLWCGDALETLRHLPDGSVNCCVTSPPYYGLRDYGEPGQYGLEPTPTAYIETMRAVFAGVRRVLAADGTLWLNLGDTYASKANAGASVGRTRRADRAELIPTRVNTTGEAPYKSLLMLPERIAWALIEDGWILRNRIVWGKTNATPESVTDRLATRHEAVFLLTRSPRYWFDLDAIREPLLHPEALEREIVFGGRNGGEGKVGASAPRGGAHLSVYGGKHSDPAGMIDARENRRGNRGAGPTRPHHPQGRNPGDLWLIPTAPFPEAHFAVFPPDLADRCVRAGCRPGGTVLDPFCGSGTTGMVALKHGRRFVGIDLSATYLDLALRTRLAQTALVDDVGGVA